MLNTSFAPWPSFSDAEIEAVSRVLRSGRVNYWDFGERRQGLRSGIRRMVRRAPRHRARQRHGRAGSRPPRLEDRTGRRSHCAVAHLRRDGVLRHRAGALFPVCADVDGGLAKHNGCDDRRRIEPANQSGDLRPSRRLALRHGPDHASALRDRTKPRSSSKIAPRRMARATRAARSARSAISAAAGLFARTRSSRRAAKAAWSPRIRRGLVRGDVGLQAITASPGARFMSASIRPAFAGCTNPSAATTA